MGKLRQEEGKGISPGRISVSGGPYGSPLKKGLLLGLPWWLRLCAPNTGGLGLIPGQRTRSHMPQLKILHAAAKIQDPPQLRLGITKSIHIFFKNHWEVANKRTSVHHVQIQICLTHEYKSAIKRCPSLKSLAKGSLGENGYMYTYG